MDKKKIDDENLEEEEEQTDYSNCKGCAVDFVKTFADCFWRCACLYVMVTLAFVIFGLIFGFIDFVGNGFTFYTS